MKRIAAFSLLCIALAFLMPPVMLSLSGHDLSIPVSPTPEASAEPQPPAQTPEASPSPSPEAGEDFVSDSEMLLAVKTGDGVRQMSMAEYLPLAISGEMPAAFDDEALKAQAVALRSYALYCCQNRKSAHPEADVCAYSSCCAALSDEDGLREKWGDGYNAYFEKVCSAAAATDGQYLVWEDEPILAVFHSSSAGHTENGSELWNPLPYLVSVDSPETAENVSNLLSSVEVSEEDFRRTINGSYSSAKLSGSPEAWLGASVRGDSGRVRSIAIGGVSISGAAMRSMFSLRSTDFDIAYNGSCFVFSVRGYGHGVGMSQYGANIMAKDGCGYAEILSHYYPGTELVVSVVLG